MNKWYIEKGEQGDIVLSTRIRLARNLKEYPFPARLDAKGRQTVNELVRDALLSDNTGGFSYLEMKSLNRSQAVSLAERHLISPEFASSGEGRALMLTEDESVSIMLCEEDHIRLQVMKAGLALNEAYETADKIDSALDSR
ncbi:MAG: ATP--guanido phosphotransferase, partial [Eubacteriales bacterium]